MGWDMRAVGPDFYEDAPRRFVYNAVLRCPPERVFDAVANDPAGLGDWYPGFDHSGRWLAGESPREGARRAVRMAGVTYEETVLAWEPPSRFGFRVDRASVPLAYALAEQYRVGPHAVGSTLEWTFAVDPRPPLRWVTGLLDPALARLFRRSSAHLEAKLRR